MAKKSDNYYFENFIQCVECGCQAAKMLEENLANFEVSRLSENLDELHKIEHDADKKKHEMMAVLVKAFITPIEREDIILLSQSIDEVTDQIEDVLIRIYINNVHTIRPEALQFTKVIIRCCKVLKEIMEEFANFKKSVEESKTQNEVNKKELQSTFEATMKLFQQEQQQAVTSLKEQTSKIGSDAANLTKALKGDSKMQGDWGEMVLETILENSGLRKDEEFFIQENTKDENGKNFRPDVIVRFPEGRSVVIDSKVSLTAYTDALAAETDEERERLMKSHAQSVRKHIDELAEKDYSKLVEDAIGFVLMFIPNETSYIAAVKQQPDLSRYAYQKKIIIISPSNLLMALQLAYNLWQYDRQNKNVEKIVKTAADLYDKVATFEDTFTGIGELITRLSGTYDKARKQLYDGTGNVMRRVESLKNLGVTPKKQIKALEE